MGFKNSEVINNALHGGYKYFNQITLFKLLQFSFENIYIIIYSDNAIILQFQEGLAAESRTNKIILMNSAVIMLLLGNKM